MQRLGVDGVEIAWDERGVGDPAFMLVHGYTGSSTDFIDHIDYFADARRVVVMDHRGHGQSDHAPPETYTLHQLSNDVISVIEHCGKGPVDLLGHSMGGRVVMMVAVARPDLVRSLVLMNTTATRVEDTWAFVRTVTDQLRIRGMDFLDENPYVEPGDWRLSDESLRLRRANRDALDVEAFIALARDFSEVPSLLDDLCAVSVPTTIVVGRRDQIRSASKAMAKAIPDCELHQIRRAYHFPHLSNPEQWRSIIDRHFERVATAAS